MYCKKCKKEVFTIVKKKFNKNSSDKYQYGAYCLECNNWFKWLSISKVEKSLYIERKPFDYLDI